MPDEAHATLVLYAPASDRILHRHAAPNANRQNTQHVDWQCNDVASGRIDKSKQGVAPDETVDENDEVLHVHQQEVADDGEGGFEQVGIVAVDKLQWRLSHLVNNEGDCEDGNDLRWEPDEKQFSPCLSHVCETTAGQFVDLRNFFFVFRISLV